MGKKRTHVIGIAAAIFIGLGGIAVAPASADESPTMPEVKDMTLDEATEAILTAAGNPDLEVHTDNIKGPEKPLVQKNWKVCWQAPEAGEPLTEDAWVGVGVAKAYLECWS